MLSVMERTSLRRAYKNIPQPGSVYSTNLDFFYCFEGTKPPYVDNFGYWRGGEVCGGGGGRGERPPSNDRINMKYVV